MTTYPLATLAATVSATGISAPSYADIFASLQASYQSIYGSDVVLTPDTQDGQWIGILASAFNDCNGTAIAVYNSFSPAKAQGDALSSNVKINGLARAVASNSTVEVTIVGQAYTVITNGIVADEQNNQWALPPTVTIPPGGQLLITATAINQGAIAAVAGTITQIVTPTLGWQSVINPGAATPGAPVEDDATLRQRQAVSTALPAQTPLQAIVAAVEDCPGVTRLQPYENDTSFPDANGVPSHSIAIVVEGGQDIVIAAAIASKKIPGGGTYGTTSEVIEDAAGVPITINFFRPTEQRIIVGIALTPLSGFVSTTAPLVQTALAAWVNALPIGADVALYDLVAAAKLPGTLGATYKIEFGGLTVGLYGSSLQTADVVIAFNAAASLQVADVAVTY